ncbi:MAG: radical SAM protein [Chloroflexi bacterium]|nr:radical SAM protein [Chloroflexota bacterium]
MNIYHLVYEPSFKSLTFHHWAKCNLACLGCFCQVEKLDFSLFDDAIKRVQTKGPETTPEKFIQSLRELDELICGLLIERAVYIGVEPSLDPDFVQISAYMKQKYNTYNVLITNGIKLTDMQHVDEVVFSLKAVSDDLYKYYTGHSNKQALKNFKIIYAMGKKLQAETLFIPGLIESDEIEKIAKFIADIDKNITLRIDGYFAINGQPWRSATTAEVAYAADIAKKYLNKVNYLTNDSSLIGEKPLRLFG